MYNFLVLEAKFRALEKHYFATIRKIVHTSLRFILKSRLVFVLPVVLTINTHYFKLAHFRVNPYENYTLE